MSTIFNDNPDTLGYWIDTENGISSRYGFFQLLTMFLDPPPGFDITYLESDGNPIPTWSIPYEVDDTIRYKGILYPELDQLYIDRSGDKLIRPRFRKRFENTSMLRAFSPIVHRITRMYSKRWLELWGTMFYDYEPLWNYDMEETLIDQITEFEHGHVDTLINGLIIEKKGSETSTPRTTYTETKSLKGFNSATFVDSDQTVTTPSGNGDTLSFTDRKDEHSGSDVREHTGTDTETKNYTLQRHGNIGVTTAMQLIESQRKLLMFNYFNEIVFPDIDKSLTLSVY